MPIDNANKLHIDSIRRVLSLVERKQVPDGTFSDLECDLWSMVRESIAKMDARAAVVNVIDETYFQDEDGRFYHGEYAVTNWEKANNATCINVRELYDFYKSFTVESLMTYEMLLEKNQKILAVQLYRKRNNCDLREAKMRIDRMCV